MDNGPELVAWALRDWCRLAGTATTYIEPGSPCENRFTESSNGRVRDELLNVEEFTSLIEAQVEHVGLPRIGLHGLRHSYATAALRAGISPEMVSKRLGHSPVVVTLWIYAHVFEQDDQAAADQVRRHLRDMSTRLFSAFRVHSRVRRAGSTANAYVSPQVRAGGRERT